jgi:transcription elongation factor GreA
MTDKVIITQQGLDNLIQELKYLIDVKRPEIASRINTAKELGDTSENAEYQLAKDEQISNEFRVSELEDLIRRAFVAKTNSHSADVGSSVKVHVEGEDEVYHLVGEPEADPLSNKISHKSPLGNLLLGKKPGDIFVLEIPNGGKVTYKVVEIK